MKRWLKMDDVRMIWWLLKEFHFQIKRIISVCYWRSHFQLKDFKKGWKYNIQLNCEEFLLGFIQRVSVAI